MATIATTIIMVNLQRKTTSQTHPGRETERAHHSPETFRNLILGGLFEWSDNK
jgi:hypothetical protein